jgi:hypothetical protein
MRTTLNLDEDVLQTAKAYADDRAISLGAAVSELARRGSAVRRPTKVVNGLRIFALPPDSPRVTSRRVRQLQAEEE